MGYVVAVHLALRPQRDHRRQELVPPVFCPVIKCHDFSTKWARRQRPQTHNHASRSVERTLGPVRVAITFVVRRVGDERQTFAYACRYAAGPGCREVLCSCQLLNRGLRGLRGLNILSLVRRQAVLFSVGQCHRFSHETLYLSLKNDISGYGRRFITSY